MQITRIYLFKKFLQFSKKPIARSPHGSAKPANSADVAMELHAEVSQFQSFIVNNFALTFVSVIDVHVL